MQSYTFARHQLSHRNTGDDTAISSGTQIFHDQALNSKPCSCWEKPVTAYMPKAQSDLICCPQMCSHIMLADQALKGYEKVAFDFSAFFLSDMRRTFTAQQKAIRR